MEIQVDAPTAPAAGAALRAKVARLRRWNTGMAAPHFARGVAMLALASAFRSP